MRMKKIVENCTLKSAAAEFLTFKRAQKIRERTLHDYQKYIKEYLNDRIQCRAGAGYLEQGIL